MFTITIFSDQGDLSAVLFSTHSTGSDVEFESNKH